MEKWQVWSAGGSEMNPADFVYDQVYKGALAEKVNEGVAQSQAVIALDRYKKNNMGGLKVGKFIKLMIQDAKSKAKKLK